MDISNPTGIVCGSTCELRDGSGTLWNTVGFEDRIDIDDSSKKCVKLVDGDGKLKEEHCNKDKYAVCQMDCAPGKILTNCSTI